MTLRQAIKIIQSIHEVLGASAEVKMIEQEDGSGTRFNYKLKNDIHPRFINLKPYQEKLEQVEEKKKLLSELEMWTYTSFSETISTTGKEHTQERTADILNKLPSWK